MKPLEGYDKAQALTGEYETLEPGGYICKVVSAKEEIARSGKRMFTIAFDIAEGEKAGFYQRRYNDSKKNNPNAKWQGTYRTMLEGEKSVGYFKGLMTILENSNPGFTWDWNEAKLKGLKFGGLFGREQYEANDGKKKFTTKIQFVRSVETIQKGEFEIPKDKMLQEETSIFGGTPYDDNSMTPVDDGDIPF